ncbi:MAG: hypothetical protein PHQ00_02330 [Phycisphaerae bacterium]|nr:hypothetical protein [Phycisphaerae bacterium]
MAKEDLGGVRRRLAASGIYPPQEDGSAEPQDVSPRSTVIPAQMCHSREGGNP